eukprot:gene18072-21527_t
MEASPGGAKCLEALPTPSTRFVVLCLEGYGSLGPGQANLDKKKFASSRGTGDPNVHIIKFQWSVREMQLMSKDAELMQKRAALAAERPASAPTTKAGTLKPASSQLRPQLCIACCEIRESVGMHLQPPKVKRAQLNPLYDSLDGPEDDTTEFKGLKEEFYEVPKGTAMWIGVLLALLVAVAVAAFSYGYRAYGWSVQRAHRQGGASSARIARVERPAPPSARIARGMLFFGVTLKVNQALSDALHGEGESGAPMVIILDMALTDEVDATILKAFVKFIQTAEGQGVPVVFCDKITRVYDEQSGTSTYVRDSTSGLKR